LQAQLLDEIKKMTKNMMNIHQFIGEGGLMAKVITY